MKIIVLNCGSSSIKYQLFDMKKNEVLSKGAVEKIGLHGSFIKNECFDGDKILVEGEIVDHQAAIEYIMGALLHNKYGVLKSLDEIEAVGHRVVHGGEKFHGSALINDEVLATISDVSDLAPLHNPPNLKGINAIQSLLPKVPQVVVFDTAFHQTMPDYAFMYAIPFSLYIKYGLRRYGFHGTSHKYVSKRACEILKVDYDKQRIITCHLGNGASITAIRNGKSIDTSMGLTPVEGLIMGTRCGDLDLGVLLYIMQKEEITISAANALINKHSGILGVTGISSDMREIEEEAYNNENKKAQLGLNMFHYRIRKYIGAYTAAMGGVDIIVFAGGIGENGVQSRAEICKDFEYMGLEFDQTKNEGQRGKEVVISKESSKVVAIVIPTNEELVIAQDTQEIVANMKKPQNN